MRISKSDRDAHPKLAAWLNDVFPNRASDPRVWRALCSIGQLSEIDARKAIALGSSNPMLKLRTLKLGDAGRLASGRFETDKPNWIQIALDLVLKVEPELVEERAARLLEATILHELVHWGRFRKSGVGELEGEEFGLDFEMEAYGKIVHRYWETASPAPLFVFPVSGEVGGGTAYWGRNIRRNGARSHFGIDIYNAIGTPVHAAADGTVIGGNRYRAGAERLAEIGNYGRMIDIDHRNGFVTRYAHLNEVEVQPGEVKQGDRIGTLGASGTEYGAWHYGGRPGGQPPPGATLPHLHFEVRRSQGAAFGDFDATYDPATFFDWMPDGSHARNTRTRALDPGRSQGEGPAPAELIAATSGHPPTTSRGLGVAYPNQDYGPSDPRGLRNNNPGNLKRSGDAWQGLVVEQADHLFFQFSEMKWGIRAMARVLRKYGQRGIRSLADIASTWAPSIDSNDPGKYAVTMLQNCEGVAAAVTDALDTDDEAILFGVCRGIIVAENGVAPAATISDDTVREGIGLERA